VCSGTADCRLPDPKYEEEVSGCTASVGIITHDKIYVVWNVPPPQTPGCLP
jgi:hypothetical protein